MSSIGVQDFDPNQKCQPNVLCSLCKNVTRESKLLRRGIGFGFLRITGQDHAEFHTFYGQLKDLLLSSRSGCHLCCLLTQTIPKDELDDFESGSRDFGAIQLKVWQPKWMRRKDNPVKRWKLGSVQQHCLVALISPTFNNLRRINKFVGVVRTHGRRRNLNFDPRDLSNKIYGPDPLALRNPHEARLCLYSGADSVYRMARKWIRDCVSGHGLCCIPSIDQTLPARLIMVGSDDSQDAPKVVPTFKLDSAVEYTTLSYCWGGASPLALTTKNVEALMQRIDMKQLPKTVADAITVTRGLNYSYLWVDSLCILQDSKDDWEDESFKMGQIYGNSICTICAGSAETADEGFLQHRNPLDSLPCCIEGTLDQGLWAVGKEESLFEKRKYHSGPVCVTDSVKSCVGDCRLYSRAWVVQERLLSRRNLHFTSEGVMWECYTTEAFESLPGGTVARNEFRWSISNILHCQYEDLIETYTSQWSDTAFHEAQFSPEPLMFNNGILDLGSRFFFLECWAKIVQEYTSCGITKPSDRLVALVGIIGRIQEVVGFDCVYGIWNMPGEWTAMQLLWHPIIGSGAAQPAYARPRQRDAPSWSWVAVDGPVGIPTASRSITTHGFLSRQVDDVIHVGKKMIEILEFPKTGRDGSHELLRLKGKVLNKPRSEINAWYCGLDTSEPADIYPLDVFFLLILDYNASFRPGAKRQKKEDEVPKLRGLILVRKEGREERYMRVGRWHAQARSYTVREPDGDEQTCLAIWEEFQDVEMKELVIL